MTYNGSLLRVSDLSLENVIKLSKKAQEMKDLVSTKGGNLRLQHRILGTIFYEPSTRTSCSFSVAMMRLGGKVMPLNLETSSAKKGESFVDTIQTMASYCDAIVLRHPSKDSIDLAAKFTQKPIINAGDGIEEHPTQALLDLFTIFSEMGRVGNFDLCMDPNAAPLKDETCIPMRITMVGDLKNGRTVHSLSRLLSLFGDIHIEYVAAHPSLEMPQEIIEELHAKGVPQTNGRTLDAAIGEADVLYVTRVQKERLESDEVYNDACRNYCVDSEIMKMAKQHMVVMHSSTEA